jgi:Lhr-like helicase
VIDDDRTHQLALALLRLAELDDQDGVTDLIASLTVEELRAVLVVQTGNLATAFKPWAVMLGLNVHAVEHDRTFAETRLDYLGQRILRMAGAEPYRDEP